MAEFSFSKSLLGNKKRGALTGSHVAYGLFVLICCWAGAQMLSMLIHAPGVFERLMQAQDASRPQVDISLAVGTLFGLIPFLIGCTFIGVLALIVRWRQRRQRRAIQFARRSSTRFANHAVVRFRVIFGLSSWIPGNISRGRVLPVFFSARRKTC